jgi:hypothetical protein
VALALASSAVRGTRLEVQDWDCPPAPRSCARPVEVRGFPRPYISDFHGISPVGRASLVGALLGEDLFRPRDFWLDAALYAGAVGVAWGAGRRVARRRAARR